MATLIGLAVLKPWDAPHPSTTGPRGSIDPTTPGLSIAGPSAAAVAFDYPTPAELIAASVPREAWGIRAIVLPSGVRPAGDGTGTGLDDRWLSIDVGAGAAWDAGVTGTAVDEGDAVLAIGITTPPDAMPLDVRFARLEPGDAVRRVVPQAIRGVEPGSWLWSPDPTEATAAGGWPAGTYVIDVLLGPRIVRLVTIVPSGVPAVARKPPVEPDPQRIGDQLGAFDAGPFALGPRGPIAIDVIAHDLLDERQAWLGPATGNLEIRAVGRVVADPVFSLGLVLEPGEQLVTVRLDRVAPVGEPMDLVEVPGPLVPTSTDSPMTSVLLSRADRDVLGPGLYHLTAVTRRPSGEERSRTWNIEIDPATIPSPPGFVLDQMARWVPLMQDPDRVASQPLITDRDLGGTDGDGTCGGSAKISPFDELIGIVDPAGERITAIRVTPIDTIRRADVAVRIAPEAVDGLSLVALPSGGIAAHNYAVIAATEGPLGSGRQIYTICVG